MKKIYGLMALAMGVATLFSCSDDDKSAAATGVQVTSAESTIKAAGGSANVEVDQNIASAYSTEGWLTVDFDGNKLSATAERNNSRESRYSTVVLQRTTQPSLACHSSELCSAILTPQVTWLWTTQVVRLSVMCSTTQSFM